MGSKLAFALIPLLLPFCLLVDGQSVDFVTHSIAPTSVQARVNSADYNRIQNIDISTTVFDLDALVKGTTQNFTGPVQPIYTITGLTEAKWYALRFVYNTRFNTGDMRFYFVIGLPNTNPTLRKPNRLKPLSQSLNLCLNLRHLS